MRTKSMAERLVLSDFEPYLRQGFPAGLEGEGCVVLELIEAKPLRPCTQQAVPGVRRDPFSLIFRGPIQPLLAQRMYEMEHPTLGRLLIFLVPLGPEGDPQGMHYQAIFN